MSLWEKIFGGKTPKTPSLSDDRFVWFLLGWLYELRSSTTSNLQEEASARFLEHFPDTTFDEATANQLLVELNAWTEQFIAGEKAAESSWNAATANDRLSAAFEALCERDLVAREDAGVSIQDGWAELGLHQKRQHRGAVFFHQQDMLDALRGESLLLAFDTFDERPNAPSAEAVGQEVMEVLTAHGLSPSWSGEGRSRISLSPFLWQKRRWTSGPAVTGAGEARGAPLTPEQLVTPESARAVTRSVMAVRSSAGFHVQLAQAFQDLWNKHGGVRGQLCHVGPPHTFVRAGEQTEMGVRNAFLNLESAEAAGVRRRARSVVIERERSTGVRAAPWSRSLWTAGGGPGRVSLIVVSATPLSALASDASPVDLPEWSPYSEVPESFSWVYRDRQTDPERFTTLESAARLSAEQLGSRSSAVMERLQRAKYGALVHGEVADPADLSHLQFGWAIARWLLERGDGAVLDTHSGQWWTRAELVAWEAGGWPTGRRFAIQREVQFNSGIAGDSWMLATMGLTKFGRPELVCVLPRDAPEPVPGWAPEVMEMFAGRLALGAQFQPGEVLKFGSMTFSAERCRPGDNAPKEAPEDSLIVEESG